MFYRECGTCNERWAIGMTSTCKCSDKKPKRKWVGLTNKEKQEIVSKEVYWAGLVYAVEAKLKEKNSV